MTTSTWSLAELRTALHTPPTTTAAASGLLPAATGGPVRVAVVGVAGGVGATVTALAIAEAIGAERLVELLAAPWASGLAEAATAELGTSGGWRIGTRGTLRIERQLDPTTPIAPGPGVSVVDVGAWSPDRSLPTAEAVVAVAGCSVPSLRRLEALLEATSQQRLVVAVIGAPVRAWTRTVRAAVPSRVRQAVADGLICSIPHLSSVSATGVTGAPLPKRLTRAAAHLLRDLEVKPSC